MTAKLLDKLVYTNKEVRVECDEYGTITGHIDTIFSVQRTNLKGALECCALYGVLTANLISITVNRRTENYRHISILVS